MTNYPKSLLWDYFQNKSPPTLVVPYDSMRPWSLPSSVDSSLPHTVISGTPDSNPPGHPWNQYFRMSRERSGVVCPFLLVLSSGTGHRRERTDKKVIGLGQTLVGSFRFTTSVSPTGGPDPRPVSVSYLYPPVQPLWCRSVESHLESRYRRTFGPSSSLIMGRPDREPEWPDVIQYTGRDVVSDQILTFIQLIKPGQCSGTDCKPSSQSRVGSREFLSLDYVLPFGPSTMVLFPFGMCPVGSCVQAGLVQFFSST